MVLNVFRIPSAGFCVQAFYTSVLVFAVVGIFNSLELAKLKKFLVSVGTYLCIVYVVLPCYILYRDSKSVHNEASIRAC